MMNRITRLPEWLVSVFRLQSAEVPRDLALDCVQPTAETVQGGWPGATWQLQQTINLTISAAGSATPGVLYEPSNDVVGVIFGLDVFTAAGNAADIRLRGRLGPGPSLNVGNPFGANALAADTLYVTKDFFTTPVVVPPGWTCAILIEGTAGDIASGVNVFFATFPAGTKPI